MGLPRKGIMVRLPRGETEERFAELCRRFRGLAPSTVMRMLLMDLLARPLSEQVSAVDRQIRDGGLAKDVKDNAPHADNSLNTNRIRQLRK